MKFIDETGPAGVDGERRASIKRLLMGAAFAAPLVASYGLSGMSKANAAPMSSNQPPPVPTVTDTVAVGLGVALAGLGAAAVMGRKSKV